MTIIDIGEITDKFGSLTLRSPNEPKGIDLPKAFDLFGARTLMGNENSDTKGTLYSVNSSQIQLSNGDTEELICDKSENGEESEESVVGREKSDLLSDIQNENYHLKLVLKEKEEELLNFKKSLRNNTHVETVFDSMSIPNSNFLYDFDSTNIQVFAEADIVSHISGSPYKGFRTHSIKTESSLASTTKSEKNQNHKWFTKCIIPFLQTSIHIFDSSLIFKEESSELIAKYQDFIDPHFDKTYKIKILDEMLQEIIFLQRQLLGILNRELHYKRINKRLEKSLIEYFDPTTLINESPEFVHTLQDEILDALVQIFGYNMKHIEHEGINNRGKYPGHDLNVLKSNNLNYSNTVSSIEEKLKNITEGLNLCSNVLKMNNNNIDTKLKNNKKNKLKTNDKNELLSRPNSGSLSVISQFSNKEKDRLKESKNSLEFFPIGYDETILTSKTPQRKMPNMNGDDFTPVSVTNNKNFIDDTDPLQNFLLEHLNSMDT